MYIHGTSSKFYWSPCSNTSREMDSSASVIQSPALNPKKGSGARRGSNPNNAITGVASSTGTDSGITSPRPESSEKRRPSVSAGKPPGPRSLTTHPQSTALISDLKNVSLFAHLPQISTNTTSPTASITGQLLKNGKEGSVHPAIIKLGLAFADYSVMGAAERCRQMLLAFKQVHARYIAMCSHNYLSLPPPFRCSGTTRRRRIRPLVDTWKRTCVP